MEQRILREAIDTLNLAYGYILAHVATGKAGRLRIMAALQSASRQLSYELPRKPEDAS